MIYFLQAAKAGENVHWADLSLFTAKLKLV